MTRAIRRGLSLAVGTTVHLLTPGAFNAAGAATGFVVSDKVTFSAQLVPNPAGGFTIQNQTCTLVSDGETGTQGCQISGTVMPTSATTFTMSSTISSPTDGRITSTANVTQSSTGSNTGKGPGTEQDLENGKVKPPYPCKVKFTSTPSLAGISGTLVVKEASTAP